MAAGAGSWDVPRQNAYIDVIEEFLTGDRPSVADIDRVLATVLFTDIVDSTRHAATLGDRRWRSVLDAHDARAVTEVVHFRGRVAKQTGDGMLATFDGPARDPLRLTGGVGIPARGLFLPHFA
jgi:class 3 adenylate cyclase